MRDLTGRASRRATGRASSRRSEVQGPCAFAGYRSDGSADDVVADVPRFATPHPLTEMEMNVAGDPGLLFSPLLPSSKFGGPGSVRPVFLCLGPKKDLTCELNKKAVVESPFHCSPTTTLGGLIVLCDGLPARSYTRVLRSIDLCFLYEHTFREHAVVVVSGRALFSDVG